MKTSNKILLAIFILLCVGMVSAIIIYARNHRGSVLQSISSSLISLKTQSINGSGKVISKEINLPVVTDLFVAANADLTVKPGNEQKVVITADDNLFNYLDIASDQGKLAIRMKPGYQLFPTSTIKIVITTNGLTKYDLSGAMHAQITGINADSFNLITSGLLACKLQGKTDVLRLTVVGASNVDAKDLIANIVHLAAGGSSKVDVYANRVLYVNLAGSGDVRYYGKPARVTQHIIGWGKIENMNNRDYTSVHQG